MNIEYRIKQFTKLLNRYFRRDENIIDWSYIFRHNSIIVQVDYISDKHQVKEFSFQSIMNVWQSDFNSFMLYVCRSFLDDYRDEHILGKSKDGE